MSKKILFIGIDGLELSYLNEFEHPFWEKIKSNSSIARIPKPEKIEEGEIATASSPRLWARYFTGVPPKKAGPVGFWERVTENGQVQRAGVDIDWIRENRCEKLVDYDTLLVDPLWEVALKNELSVGATTPWFSFPLSDEIKKMIDENGKWILTDWKYPRDDERMKPDLYRWPRSAEPKENFEEETGSGARLPMLASREPRELVRRMKKQDADRYEYTLEQIKEKGTPDLCIQLTRAVDGLQHILNNQEVRWQQEGGFVQEGETIDEEFADPDDLEEVYNINMDGIEELWNTGKFDVLIIVSDHGSGALDGGDAHEWPATAIMYGEDIPTFTDLEGWYEDVPVTILGLLGVDPPDYMTGSNILAQAEISEKLSSLGYF